MKMVKEWDLNWFFDVQENYPNWEIQLSNGLGREGDAIVLE